MCEKYLLTYHKNEIFALLKEENETQQFVLNINFLELFENDPNLGNNILNEPENSLETWNASLLKIQNDLILRSDDKLMLKHKVNCRIFGLPICPELHRTIFPKNEDVNKFLQISGNIVRIAASKLLEFQRKYICSKCKYTIWVKADYEKKNIIVAPKKCTNPDACTGTNLVKVGQLDADDCKDYQEVKIQEIVSKLEVGTMPNSMWITLEDDLVDSCKPGDNVTICGIVKRRWGMFSPGQKMDIELVVKANHVQVNNNHSTGSLITPEMTTMFETFWKTYSDRPLVARDIILKSICPELFGMYVVKLATAVVLAGGSRVQVQNSYTGLTTRAEPHLLLVGDPGTGKSQLLRFASKIIPRSVLTTGVGSTAAGLTVTAIMENGEWQLEGGALVLADGGICCIDEFNSMKEHDRTSIHEAMEQQTISVAKAGIVCKLSTKCSILAATNPKGNIDPSLPLNMNIALASPLLSRFDLVLLLRDTVNDVWDTLVCDYILNNRNNCSKFTSNLFWTIEMLQSYFAIIKKINPKLTDGANRILGAYYQAQRMKNCRNKSRTTVRLLDSLIRLSQGHARLMYHNQVEVIDAITAVVLVETGMEHEYSLLNLNFNIQNSLPHSPTKSYKELVEIVLNKLNLSDLIRNEIDSIKDDSTFDSHDFNELHRQFIHKTESRFFSVRNRREHLKNKNEQNLDNTLVNRGNDYHDEVLSPNNKKGKSKRSKTTTTNINPKKIKLNDTENNTINDLNMLNLLPSVNDVFPINDILNVDLNSSTNFPNCSTSKTEENSERTLNKENDDSIRREAKTNLYFQKFKFIPKEAKTETSLNNCTNTDIGRIPKSKFGLFDDGIEDINLDL